MVRASLIPALLVCHALVAQDAGPKRLSLQEAIQASVENNLQVQVAKETRESSKAGVLVSEGAFDWTLGGTLNYGKQESTSNKPLFQGLPSVKSESTGYSRNLTATLSKPFQWGGHLEVRYAPNYTSSQSTTFLKGTVNPDTGGTYANDRFSATEYPYTGNFSASYTQNLLKGFGRRVTETNLIVARKTSQQADYTFQQTITDLVATTESLYWDVVFAQQNLENKQQALALAEKQLKENKIRVEVGTLAPIEVTSAEAAVAQKDQEIIAAEAQLQNAKDVLLRTLYPSSERPSSLVLTDVPKVEPINLQESLTEKMALEKRLELKSARLDTESKQVLEHAAADRLKPTLDASFAYNGGSDSHRGLGPVNGDLTAFRNPGYTVGLTFSMPIANKAAKGSLAQARANRRSSELNLRDQELAIRLEVRQAMRNLQAAEKGVAAAEKTRIFRDKDWQAEQKKFENGMSSNFLVLSKQNDLDFAKANELQARISYAKAATALEKASGNLLEARRLEVR